MTTITKSLYLDGLRCEKLLWFRVNAEEDIPPPDAGARAQMEEGSRVGRLAHNLYPGGTLVSQPNWAEASQETQALLKGRKPIFEAAFMANGMATRVDILVPAIDGGWHVLEVKSHGPQ